MTKLSKSSNPIFLVQLGIWFTASSASSPGTSFYPRFLIEGSAKREWLVTKRKGPAVSYFIRDTWPTISAGALFSNKRAAQSV